MQRFCASRSLLSAASRTTSPRPRFAPARIPKSHHGGFRCARALSSQPQPVAGPSTSTSTSTPSTPNPKGKNNNSMNHSNSDAASTISSASSSTTAETSTSTSTAPSSLISPTSDGGHLDRSDATPKAEFGGSRSASSSSSSGSGAKASANASTASSRVPDPWDWDGAGEAGTLPLSDREAQAHFVVVERHERARRGCAVVVPWLCRGWGRGRGRELRSWKT